MITLLQIAIALMLIGGLTMGIGFALYEFTTSDWGEAIIFAFGAVFILGVLLLLIFCLWWIMFVLN